jgi:hypothetical protein
LARHNCPFSWQGVTEKCSIREIRRFIALKLSFQPGAESGEVDVAEVMDPASWEGKMKAPNLNRTITSCR